MDIENWNKEIKTRFPGTLEGLKELGIEWAHPITDCDSEHYYEESIIQASAEKEGCKGLREFEGDGIRLWVSNADDDAAVNYAACQAIACLHNALERGMDEVDTRRMLVCSTFDRPEAVCDTHEEVEALRKAHDIVGNIVLMELMKGNRNEE